MHRATLPGVTMKARLEGDEYDLQDLANWLPNGEICVTKDDEGFYLTATAIDNPPAGMTFHNVAPEVLKIANGLGCVKSPDSAQCALLAGITKVTGDMWS
jgi:hypothetical protein